MSTSAGQHDGAVELQVFTRVPAVGKVKTRLIPALGAEGAMRLHRALAERTLGAAAAIPGVRRSLWFDGAADDPWLAAMQLRDPSLVLHPQSGADLGERMYRALLAGCAGGSRALLFGTDCPGLDADCIDAAVCALAGGADLVLGPVEDGGYVLIGLRNPIRELFTGVPWSTSAVLGTTLDIAARLRLAVVLLPERWDVDVPADVARLAALGLPAVEALGFGGTQLNAEEAR